MAANQTIIQAAKAAYTRHTPDISGQLKSMAAISEMVTSIAAKASKKTDELNKAFNAVDYLDKKDLKAFGLSIRNNPDLSQEEKIEIFTNLKNSTNTLEEWSNTVGDLFANDGELLSGSMDPKEKAWLATIITGDYFGKDFDFDDDGKPGITKYDEDDNPVGILQPIKMIDNQLQILNQDGEYTSVDKLKSKFTKKTDGDEVKTAINKLSSPKEFKASGFSENTSGLNSYMELKAIEIKNLIESDKNATESLKYDKIFNMDGVDGGQTFVEWFLQNGSLWDVDTKKGDNQAIIDQINLELKSLESGAASDLSEESKKEWRNNLYRELVQTGANIEGDLLNFLKQSIRYTQDLTLQTSV
jgi:hypothetical protein